MSCDIEEKLLQLSRQTTRLLQTIRHANAEAPRLARNDARVFHAWMREHVQAEGPLQCLEAMEREHPWLLEPEEPKIISVPL